MKLVNQPNETPNISREALLVRVAMAAGIAGAVVASLVVGIPAVVIAAGIITAAAAVLVLR